MKEEYEGRLECQEKEVQLWDTPGGRDAARPRQVAEPTADPTQQCGSNTTHIRSAVSEMVTSDGHLDVRGPPSEVRRNYCIRTTTPAVIGHRWTRRTGCEPGHRSSPRLPVPTGGGR